MAVAWGREAGEAAKVKKVPLHTKYRPDRINKPFSMSNNTQGKVIITGSVEPAEKRR